MEYPSKVSQPLNKQDKKVNLEFVQRNVLHTERERDRLKHREISFIPLQPSVAFSSSCFQYSI